MARVTSGSAQAGRTEVRPRLGIASRLPGASVRFDDGNAALGFRTRELRDYIEWVPVGPEIEIGAGAPCEARQLDLPAGAPRGLGGAEHSDAPAEVTDRDRPALDGCVLTGPSPSRGRSSPLISERARRATGRGPDVDTAYLSQLPPELPVEEQDRLDDVELREHFVERVFAHARLRRLFEGDWSPSDLMSFQARHKMQLMAHSVEGARRLGRIAARAGAETAETIRGAYTREFGRVLSTRITPGGHTNALQHLFGMVSDRLDDTRRRDVLDAIERHRRGEVPLAVPVMMVRKHCAAEPGLIWAAEQTYLAPYPPALSSPSAPGQSET